MFAARRHAVCLVWLGSILLFFILLGSLPLTERSILPNGEVQSDKEEALLQPSFQLRNPRHGKSIVDHFAVHNMTLKIDYKDDTAKNKSHQARLLNRINNTLQQAEMPSVPNKRTTMPRRSSQRSEKETTNSLVTMPGQRKNKGENAASATSNPDFGTKPSTTTIATAGNGVDGLSNYTTTINDGGDNPMVIAHVVSFADCNAKQKMRGYLDAMLVLRHSIHVNSIHYKHGTLNGNDNNSTRSKYSYQMYAILLDKSNCPKHIDDIASLGYTPLVRNQPMNISAIPNEFYRDNVEQSGVVGSKEFIKLHVYTLTNHSIAVHWDLDMILLKPMDHVYDAMLYPPDSHQGQEARDKLEVQRPLYQRLPDTIEAMFTRDIATANAKAEHQVAQGGLLIIKPSLEVFEKYVQVVMKGDYRPGCGARSGWGGKGYGCKMGSFHFQGIVAYFYDFVYKHRHVELDVCRHNQVAHDTILRGMKSPILNGKCRQFPWDIRLYDKNTPEHGGCEYCPGVPLEETVSIHFTTCGKPWQCRLPPLPKNDTKEPEIFKTNTTLCGLMHREFFRHRRDLEDRLENLLGHPVVSRRNGMHHPEYFLGYCHGERKYQHIDQLAQHTNFTIQSLYGF